jgi:hypothetical protein
MNVIAIQIINIKLIKTNGDKKSNLHATIDFRLNDSEFYSWRIIQQPNQHAFVSPPQESWLDGDTRMYKPLIKLKPNLMKSVSDKLIEEYQKELDK